MSQSNLARKTGMKQPAISRIESGAIVPRVDTLSKLLRACGEDLEARPRIGMGVDRTVMALNLKQAPDQRLRGGVFSYNAVARMMQSPRKP